jgi:CubicO group peptidase (beta-lactamase class C family)
MGPDVWGDRQERLRRMADWRLNWEPGTQHEYHPTSAHWVLAELIQRASGIDYRDFIRERIADPLGLAGLRVGVPPEEQGDMAALVATGEAVDPEELERLTGFRELPLGEVTEENLLHFNDPDARAVGVPGGGGVARAADLALYYQALLHNSEGLWDTDVLKDGTSTVRNSFPDFLALGAPANRTRGIVVAGGDGHAAARGFGHTTSARAFGHNGAGGQVAWVDPESGLSFCYLTNGLDANLLRQWRRDSSLSSKAAVCAT